MIQFEPDVLQENVLKAVQHIASCILNTHMRMFLTGGA